MSFVPTSNVFTGYELPYTIDVPTDPLHRAFNLLLLLQPVQSAFLVVGLEGHLRDMRRNGGNGNLASMTREKYRMGDCITSILMFVLHVVFEPSYAMRYRAMAALTHLFNTCGAAVYTSGFENVFEYLVEPEGGAQEQSRVTVASQLFHFLLKLMTAEENGRYIHRAAKDKLKAFAEKYSLLVVVTRDIPKNGDLVQDIDTASSSSFSSVSSPSTGPTDVALSSFSLDVSSCSSESSPSASGSQGSAPDRKRKRSE